MTTRKKQGAPPAGPSSAGQSGDTQQVPRDARADSESVEELTEEGNAYEAGIIDGVENAKDPDVEEVRTRQPREDDVPPEYLGDEDDHAA